MDEQGALRPFCSGWLSELIDRGWIKCSEPAYIPKDQLEVSIVSSAAAFVDRLKRVR